MWPDAPVLFTDSKNPITGDSKDNRGGPSRDRTHGRVYRVTYAGRPLVEPAKIAGQPIDKLLDLLKDPDDRVRYRARIELGGRPSDEAVTAIRKWVDRVDTKDTHYEHHR